MPDRDMIEKLRLVTWMSVAAHRHMGEDDATIRREVVAVMAEAIEGCVEDQGEQETLLAEGARLLDEAIAQTGETGPVDLVWLDGDD
jgi:hypothetical protein